ncbi:MAG: hypothetical protein CVU57_01110 [Deltaproteobacteria bacterium HGW-Deltaproteobacteria-15]|jgi:phosphate-selective porin|nr:MAG: hypothetical protein CVU57_01110 [Deltaproteobacteria bacterium HGW-Deltaproteobacteria-15]
MSWGSKAEVLEPASLKEEIRKHRLVKRSCTYAHESITLLFTFYYNLRSVKHENHLDTSTHDAKLSEFHGVFVPQQSQTDRCGTVLESVKPV